MIGRLINGYLEAYRGLPRQAWLLAAVLLVNRSGTMVVPFFALFLTQDRAFTVAQAGQLIASFACGSILGNFLGGYFTNRRGPFVVQVVSLVLTGVGFLAILQARTWWEFAATMFLTSCASDMIRPSIHTATTIFAPPGKQAQALALNRLAVNLGMTIGPTMGGFLATIGFQYLFYVDAATCFAAAFVTAIVFRSVFFSSATQLEQAQPTREVDATARTGSPWRDGEFLFVIFLNFFLGLVFFQITGTLVLYYEEVYEFTKPTIGMLFAVNTVLIVLLEMFIIHRVSHVSRLRLVRYGGLLISIGFGLMPFGRGVAFCILTIVVWTAGEMFHASPNTAFVASRCTAANRGGYLGLLGTSFSLAFVFGPLIGTWIYQHNPDWVWYACIPVGLLAFFGYRWIERRIDRTNARRLKIHDPMAA